jgi:hypothetical protein
VVRRASGTAAAASYVECILMANAEELSEEDQQLKSELDMLVERILVCRLRYHTSCAPTVCADLSIGIRLQPVQARSRPDQGIHQDIDEFHDSSAQAAQVPATPL